VGVGEGVEGWVEGVLLRGGAEGGYPGGGCEGCGCGGGGGGGVCGFWGATGSGWGWGCWGGGVPRWGVVVGGACEGIGAPGGRRREGRLVGLGEGGLGGGRVVEGLLGAGLAERVAELRDLLVGDGVLLPAELAPGHQVPLAVELFAVLVCFGRVGQGGHGGQEGRHRGGLRVEVFPFGGAVRGGGEGGHGAGGGGDVPLVVETGERRVVFRHRAEVLHREGGFAAIRFWGLGRWSWCAYRGSCVGVLPAPLSTKI